MIHLFQFESSQDLLKVYSIFLKSRHPTEDRHLSVREIMRLMCLPDDFPEIPRTKASKKTFFSYIFILYYKNTTNKRKEKNTSTVNLYSVNI